MAYEACQCLSSKCRKDQGTVKEMTTDVSGRKGLGEVPSPGKLAVLCPCLINLGSRPFRSVAGSGWLTNVL